MQKEKSNTSDRELKISRVLNAPVKLVWEVWTNPEHIRQWWGPNGFTTTIHQMQMVEGAEWLLTMHGPDGTNYPNKSVFTEIVQYKRIKYRHYSPNFTATVEFEQQDDKTLMQWHMLFDTVAEFEAVVKTYKADEGLKQNVDKLENYLSKKNIIIMTTILQTNFTKDTTNKKIILNRSFNAPLDLVWRAWTESNLLDQWWMPKPWIAKTKSLSFEVGGTWFYSSSGPDGTKMWEIREFTSINKHSSFEAITSFCDENGNKNSDFPSMNWKIKFIATDTGTKVEVEISFKSEADIKKIIEMGFEAGFASALGNLDKLLEKE